MLALLLSLTLACTEAPATALPSAPPTPQAAVPEAPKLDPAKLELAVTVANAIKAAPDNSAAILADNGLSREQLDTLLYEVALDPAAAALYAERTH